MNNKNKNLLSQGKNVTEWIAFKIILPLFAVAVIIFNPISVFVFSLLLVFILSFKFLKEGTFLKKFLWRLGIIYASILSLLSLSPRLKYWEFKIFNPNYKEVNATIVDYKIDWHKTTKGTSVGPKATIKYLFSENGKLLKDQNKIQRYSSKIYHTKKVIEKRKNILSKKIEQYKNEKNFAVFYNQEKNTSELFMPLNTISFNYSLFWHLFIFIFKFFSGISIFFYIMGKLFFNDKK